MITGLKVAVLAVSDVDLSQAFYETLGFITLLSAEPMPSRRWVELELPQGGSRIALVNAAGWEQPVSEGPAFTFGCDDVLQTSEELRSKGVAVIGPDATEWGPSARVIDPDGHMLVLGAQTGDQA